jgi:hypothetical protein
MGISCLFDEGAAVSKYLRTKQRRVRERKKAGGSVCDVQ